MTQFAEQLDFTQPSASDARTPSAGEQRKNVALNAHETHKKEAIKWLRRKMVELYNDRRFNIEPKIEGVHIPCVNADDARRVYEASSFPKAYSQNSTFFGSIFRGKDWMQVGRRVKSTHPANNARKIDCWMPQ